MSNLIQRGQSYVPRPRIVGDVANASYLSRSLQQGPTTRKGSCTVGFEKIDSQQLCVMFKCMMKIPCTVDPESYAQLQEVISLPEGNVLGSDNADT